MVAASIKGSALGRLNRLFVGLGAEAEEIILPVHARIYLLVLIWRLSGSEVEFSRKNENSHSHSSFLARDCKISHFLTSDFGRKLLQ